jgi:hypothetical protein
LRNYATSVGLSEARIAHLPSGAMGVSEAPIVVAGEGRVVGRDASNQPLRFELRPADFVVSGGGVQMVMAYRDLATVAVDQGRMLLDLGGGQRVIAERLGAGLGTLLGALRDRRARQTLSDRFIEVPYGDAIELVEYQSGDERGVAQLAYHAWGVALLPLDERQPWRLVRRADVSGVTADHDRGRLTVELRPRPSLPSATPIELIALGATVERERAKIDGLRAQALADAGSIVNVLLPDAQFADRAAAAALLVDGRPVTPAELSGAWSAVERSVLADPTFAASYAALAKRSGSGGSPAKTWVSLAPITPGQTDQHMAWFFVALPGDLVAFELVSEGAHATYLFRAADSLEAAVFDISECLIDSRFLREPIYMTDAELAHPDNARYRLAIAAMPSLRAARARFIQRLIHTDQESWESSLDDAIHTGGA